MGKTLEAKLGGPEVEAFLSRIRRGVALRVRGVVKGERARSGRARASEPAVDAVAAEVEVLEEWAVGEGGGTATKSAVLGGGSLAGGGAGQSERRLVELLCDAGGGACACVAMPGTCPSFSFLYPHAHPHLHPHPFAVDSAVIPEPDAVARVVTRAAARKAAFQDKKGRKDVRGTASDTPSPAAFWQCTLPETSIVVVDNVPKLLACWAQVTGDAGSEEIRNERQARAREAQSTSAPAHVCGVDAEWDPYGPSLPRTPVSLLQLSTRDRCFVLDLLALCRSPHARITDKASRPM